MIKQNSGNQKRTKSSKEIRNRKKIFCQWRGKRGKAGIQRDWLKISRLSGSCRGIQRAATYRNFFSRCNASWLFFHSRHRNQFQKIPARSIHGIPCCCRVPERPSSLAYVYVFYFPNRWWCNARCRGNNIAVREHDRWRNRCPDIFSKANRVVLSFFCTKENSGSMF